MHKVLPIWSIAANSASLPQKPHVLPMNTVLRKHPCEPFAVTQTVVYAVFYKVSEHFLASMGCFLFVPLTCWSWVQNWRGAPGASYAQGASYWAVCQDLVDFLGGSPGASYEGASYARGGVGNIVYPNAL